MPDSNHGQPIQPTPCNCGHAHGQDCFCGLAGRVDGNEDAPSTAPLGDLPMFGDPAGPWIKTFAWRPRWTFDAGTVWLRPVWKRHIYKHQYLIGGADWWWQFRRFAP